MKLYHYTTLDALEKILKEENITFWATRYDSMNDPLDYTFAKKILLPKIRKLFEKDDNSEFIDAYPYIVSFSTKCDDFNMWRMYNAEVALEFEYEDIRKVVENNSMLNLGQCIYVDEHDIVDEFDNLYSKYPKSDNIYLDAQALFTLLKRKEFNNENEMRLYNFSHDLFRAQYDETQGCVITDCETSNLEIGVKCVKNKDYVLYQEFILPKNILSGIIIYNHNTTHFESVKNHLKTILSNRLYDNKVVENIKQTKTAQIINN